MPKNSNSSNDHSINKSQAIREMLGLYPEAKPKEIVTRLAQRNIDVKPSMIYVVKGKLAQMKHQQGRKAKRVANASEKTGSSDPVALILKVKQLAKDAGGLTNLQRLVDVLAE